MSKTTGRRPTKRTLAAAKWPPQDVMTVSSDHLLLSEAGDSFRSPIEKKDAPALVMSNDPFHQVVKDLLQISFVGYQAFQVQIIHLKASFAAGKGARLFL